LILPVDQGVNTIAVFSEAWGRSAILPSHVIRPVTSLGLHLRRESSLATQPSFQRRLSSLSSLSTMAVHITHLPPEILHSILSHVDPEDLAWLPLTCRLFNNFIKGNNPLYRAIYARILVCFVAPTSILSATR